MKKKQQLVSVLEYAQLCGISFAGVKMRAKLGLICFFMHKTLKNNQGNPKKFVDIAKYPPTGKLKTGPKTPIKTQ